MSRKRFNLYLCLGGILFYLLNHFCLKPMIGGWFLAGYANDITAGILLVAWLDLMLYFGHRSSIDSWQKTVLFLLLCGFVWEFLTPIWKSNAVFDIWDLLAYQIGGILYFLLQYLFKAK